MALYFFSALQKTADTREYFYHISNRKEMSHAKLLLLNTFQFCERPLTVLGKASICIFTFYEPNSILGNYRSSCATQQLKPNPTFSVVLFHHLWPLWDMNKVGGQWIRSELMVWADILLSSNNSSLEKTRKWLFIKERIFIQDWLDGAWEQNTVPLVNTLTQQQCGCP